MFDSYKVFEKYPELKDETEPVKVNVGRALQDLLECVIDSERWSVPRAETVYYDCYPMEECNCSDSESESEYMSVLRRIEKHPATLKMNYEELPDNAKIIFEAKADYLLKIMKEHNFRFSIDIDKFSSEFSIVFCNGQNPIVTYNGPTAISNV